jgi:hypothetical protein
MAAGNSPGIFGFDPRSVPGMALWLDAADASSLTFSSGSNVSAWRDKSGNSQSFTVTGTPTLTSNAQNGSSAVTFNGTSYFYNTTLSTPIASHTSFVVAKFTGTGYYGIVSFTSGAVSSYQSPNAFRYAGQGGTTLTNDMLDVYANNGAYQILTSVATNNAFLFCEQTSNTTPYPTGSMYYNGAIPNVTSSAQFNYTPGTATGVVVGSYWYSSTSNANFIGNIYEVISYNQTLTTSQRQQVEGYLAWKWGLNANLVGGLTKPTQIPGCALWVDAADSSTVTLSGSNITALRDKSGLNHTFTATGTPILQANALNGNSGLSFNGSSYLYNTTSQIPVLNHTVFCVAAASNVATNTTIGTLISFASGTISVEGSSNAFTYRFYTNYSGIANAFDIINSPISYRLYADVANTTPNIYAETINAATGGLHINGTVPTYQYSDFISGGSGTTQGCVLGCRWQGASGADRFYNGNIYEIITFNTALTSTQRQSVEGYLATKWGLRASLPATHPSYTGIAAQPFAITRPFARRFQPVDIPGCALWLDAASLTFSSGSNVSSWKDKSPNAFPFTVVSGQSAPVLQQSFNGNYPAVTALNTTSVMYYQTQIPATTLISSTGITYFMVGKCSSGALLAKFFDAGSGVRIISFETGSSFRSDFNTTIVSPGNNTLIPFLICSRYDGASTAFTLFYNGISVASSNVTAPSYSFTSWIALFGQYTGQGDFYGAAGSICEFLSYSSSLSTSQRQQVEGYLAWKWGLNSQLPGVPLNPQWQSGLALWLDAADSSTISFSSGSNISTWRDKATGISCVASNSPTLVVNSQNGLPVVNFVGTSTQFFTAVRASGFPSVKTYFMVYSNSLSNVGQTLLGGSVFTQQGGGTTFQDESGYTSGTPAFQTGGSYRIVSSLPIATAASPSLNGSVFMNGSQISLISSSGNYVPSGTTIYIGTGNQPYTGTIAEFILFNTALTTSQRQGVETYLARKWGLTVPTSTPHPFFRLPSSSVAVFSPTMISGCALWLDAADQSTVTGTTSMTSWRDKSSNAYSANSFVNSVANPSWVSNIQNGNGVVRYSTGNGSAISNFVLAQTISIFMVYYPINQTIGFFIEQGPNENTNPGFYLYTLSDNNFAINSGTGQVAANFPTNVVTSNTWQMVGGINPDPANSSTMAYYINGVTRASGSTQSGTTPVTATLFLNGRNGTNNVSYNTYIAEVIIFNTALTTSQRQQVEGYLAQKWGISIPTSHPYTKFAPASI